MTCGGDFCTLWKPPAVQPRQSGGLPPNAGWTAFIESPVKDLGWVSLRGPLSCPAKKLRKNAAQGAIATGNRFQKPKWSSIPRQCAHWHGIYWMRGCSRRKRRNPAFLNEMRAGRILKEDGLVCGSKPFSASLSRILSPFLGGTRKGPPEGYPAEGPDRAFDKPNSARCAAIAPLRLFEKLSCAPAGGD